MTRYLPEFCLLLLSLLAGSCKKEVKPFTFGVMADCQYCFCETKGSRHYTQSLGKMQEAVDFYNQNHPGFVAHLGDFIDRDFSSFDSVLAISNKLKAPLKMVLGNHEFAVNDSLKHKVAEKAGLGSPYYSFEMDGWKFIVTDGNEVSVYSSTDSTKIVQAREMLADMERQGRANAKEWNGALSAEQMEWLDNELEEADNRGVKAIVFNHFPIAPENEHNLLNDKEVYNLVMAHPSFVAWFNGHNHAGNYTQANNRHFVTFHGMVETSNTNAYSMVRVYPDSLVLDGKGREPRRVLRFADSLIRESL